VSYIDPENINGLNLYAYCNNNPVMYSDSSEHLGILATFLIATVTGELKVEELKLESKLLNMVRTFMFGNRMKYVLKHFWELLLDLLMVWKV